jgi:hypothetical protein
MPTLTAQLPRRAPRAALLRHRAPFPALIGFAPAPAAAALDRPAFAPSCATHDFLVPNPRPDLTLDAPTLRMLETD